MEMTRTDLVFVGLVVALGVICYGIGGTQAVIDALLQAKSLLLSVLPQLAGGLLIGGMVKQLVGREKISTLLGAGAGLRGLIVATAAGAVTPGGPFMSFPIAYALWTAGAGAGVLVTYIVAWSLLGFVKLTVWELPLMGIEFTSVRFLVSLPLPILAGLVAERLSRLRVFHFDTGAER